MIQLAALAACVSKKSRQLFWGKKCTPEKILATPLTPGWRGLRIFWPRNDLALLLAALAPPLFGAHAGLTVLHTVLAFWFSVSIAVSSKLNAAAADDDDDDDDDVNESCLELCDGRRRAVWLKQFGWNAVDEAVHVLRTEAVTYDLTEPPPSTSPVVRLFSM